MPYKRKNRTSAVEEAVNEEVDEMKRALSLLILIAMAFALSGCGQKGLMAGEAPSTSSSGASGLQSDIISMEETEKEALFAQLAESFQETLQNNKMAQAGTGSGGMDAKDIIYKITLLAGTADDFYAEVHCISIVISGGEKTMGGWDPIYHFKRNDSGGFDMEMANYGVDLSGLPQLGIEKTYPEAIDSLTESERYYARLDQDKAMVTYNGGIDWVTLPVESDTLTRRAESEGRLQEGAYIITPEHTYFVYGGWDGTTPIQFVLSTDGGQHFQTGTVTEDFPYLRAAYLSFSSETEGTLLLCGNRQMTYEDAAFYRTTDGGLTWEPFASTDAGNYHMNTGGMFLNSTTGFLCKKTGEVYRTSNGGKSWSALSLPFPEDIAEQFTSPLTPTFTGAEGTLLIGQGENSDYGVGKVAKFTSSDYGASWKYEGIFSKSEIS